MFGRAKSITAGALVIAIGGLIVVDRPLDQGGGQVAAASDAEVVAPVPVTGTGPSIYAGCSSEDVGETAELYRSIFTCDVTWAMSDPRLEGDVTRISEAVDMSSKDLASVKTDDDDWPRVSVSGHASRNHGGSWRERPRPAIGTAATEQSTWPHEAVTTMVFDGEEGYEGLVAVLQRDVSSTGSQVFNGVIIDSRLMPSGPEGSVPE